MDPDSIEEGNAILDGYEQQAAFERAEAAKEEAVKAKGAKK